MEKFTVNTENLVNETNEAIITINGIQDLMDEIKEVSADKELDTDRKKYIAILGACQLFSNKYGYKFVL